MTFKVIAVIYGLFGLFSLVIVPLSVKGWLGVEPDPLSGVFALILGLPWTLSLKLFDYDNPYFSLFVCFFGISINTWLLLRLGKKDI